MILKMLIQLLINSVDFVLTPLHAINNIFGNILESTGAVALIRMSTFFFTPVLITFLIDTFVFWGTAFSLRPLVNFIRNKS